MTQGYQIRYVIFFSLLLAVLESCCHAPAGTSCKPITNNPEILGCDKEWKPDVKEPYWKNFIYQTVKNCTDDDKK